METIIPIIIAIVVFAFQAYANFQKEQDKARKRDVGQPPLPEDNAKRTNPVPALPSEPVPAGQPGFESYSGVMDAETMVHARRTTQRPIIPQRLAVDEDTSLQPLLDGWDFDLRDAVIKSAILERPYQ